MGSNMAFALDASRPRATHDGHAPVRWIPAWTDVQMDDAGIGPLPLEHRAWVRDRAMRWRSTPPPSPMRGGGPWHCISVRYSERWVGPIRILITLSMTRRYRASGMIPNDRKSTRLNSSH